MNLIKLLNTKEKINTTNWKEFKIGDLFECKTTNNISGTIANKHKTDSIDGINYITRKTTSNGIEYKVRVIEKEEILDGNCITIGAEGFVAFYQKDKFYGGVKVYQLRNKNLNKFNALFVCSLINSYTKNKYSYGNAYILDKIKETVLFFPAKSNNEPDWEYMENYVSNIYKTLMEKIPKIVNLLNTKEKINTTNWKEFKIGDLFEVSRGKRIVRTRDYMSEFNEEYQYPVITPTLKNNGIDGYYTKTNFNENVLIVGGDVSGMQGFYQDKKGWAVDTTRILKPKFNFMNKYIGLFILVLVQQYKDKFNFQKKANPSDIEKLIIKLPVDSNGDPDWEYMENYIKSLPYSKYL